MALKANLITLRDQFLAENKPAEAKIVDTTLIAIERLEALAFDKPPEIFDIHGKKVVILNATQSSFNWRTHFTLFRNYAVYGPEKISLIPQGQTVIHEARNMLAHSGLQTDAEWFIMGPDDDLIPPCGSAQITNRYFNARLPEPLASYNAITRIMSHPPECRVVGALYFVKGNKTTHSSPMAGKAVCSQAFSDEKFNQALHHPTPTSGLIKQDWVAIGFCRIHRSVFEDLIKAADGRWPEIIPTLAGQPYGLFQPLAPNVNEDISFGRRCKAIGIQHYLDSGLVCGHADGTTVYWPHNTQ